MIELEHGDLRLGMPQGPTVEASTQDHVLVTAMVDTILKGIFRVSTPNNDQGTDGPDLGDERPPEKPAEWRYTQYRTQRRSKQPYGGSILKDSRTIVHEMICPVRGCELSRFTGFHLVPPD